MGNEDDKAQKDVAGATKKPTDEGEPRHDDLRDDFEASDEPRPDETGEPRGRFARLTRRILDRRDIGDDARQLMTAFIDTSDRAKTEMVRMAAREVRSYLEALKLKEDLMELVTSHSLEISVHLKPLAESQKAPSAPPAEGDDEDEGPED